jgi:hypothetical protein
MSGALRGCEKEGVMKIVVRRGKKSWHIMKG